MSASSASPATAPSSYPREKNTNYSATAAGGSRAHIKQYYEDSGLDYAYWSRSFNMHFGYFERGMSPFKLEAMLENMNRKVLDFLGIKRGSVLDLGCGAGATAKQLAAENTGLAITGVSLVGEQIGRARAACKRLPEVQQPRFVEADYTALPFGENQFDGAWNLESACHAPGADKRALVNEAYRVLKPGASWVVVDGFLKRPPRLRTSRWILDKVHDYWALETFAERDAFLQALREAGFVDIEIVDWSWRIAPSAAYIPWVTAVFFVDWLRKEKARAMGRHRLANALAPILGLCLGLSRSFFGYYAIRARKPAR